MRIQKVNHDYSRRCVGCHEPIAVGLLYVEEDNKDYHESCVDRHGHVQEPSRPHHEDHDDDRSMLDTSSSFGGGMDIGDSGIDIGGGFGDGGFGGGGGGGDC
jgi:uncharacterized membrane protein YgcG